MTSREGDWSKIDSALEVKIKQTVNDFHTGRGRFLNSYAQIEYFALDIISKVKEIITYRNLVTKFPSSIGARISMIDSLLDAQGVLQNYRETLLHIRNTLEDNSETRNFLAHGFSKVTYTPTGIMGIELFRYDPTSKPNPWRALNLVYEFTEFEFMVSEIDKSASKILLECRNMYQRLNFEANISIQQT